MRRRVEQMRVAVALLMWMPLAGVTVSGHSQDVAQPVAPRISATEVADLMRTGNVVILDVRDAAMFRRGHLPAARLASPDQWREVAVELKTSTRPIVTYCSCPQEETSLRAAERFAQLGVSGVRALTGGYEGWEAAGRPVVKPEAEPQTNVSQQPAGGTATGDGSRDSWQRVPDVFAAMGVTTGSVVADIGAGDGYFTLRLAKAVGPSGRVYAVDISKNALDRLKQRVTQEGLTNVEAVLSAPADPQLPEGVLDAALVVNAYHEMREHQAVLAGIRTALKPTGRLVILESVSAKLRGTSRASQESRHELAPQYLQRDLLDGDFYVTRFDEEFTRRGGNHSEYLIVATPTPVPTVAPPDAHEDTVAARQPDAVVAALGLKAGMTVFDVGAGSGAFTRRFAQAVGPTGRAIGLDIDPAAVETMKQEAAALRLSNYGARLVAPDDPAIAPGTADVIFFSNAYHHLANRVAYARRLRPAFTRDGRLVIVDFPPDAGMRARMPEHPDRAQVERELAEAGFRLIRSHDFLKGQFFLEFAVK